MAEDLYKREDDDLDMAELVIRRLSDSDQKEELLSIVEEYRKILESYRFEVEEMDAKEDSLTRPEFTDFVLKVFTFCHRIIDEKNFSKVPQSLIPESPFRDETYSEVVLPHTKLKARDLKYKYELSTEEYGEYYHETSPKFLDNVDQLLSFIREGHIRVKIKGVTYVTRGVSQEEEQEVSKIAIEYIRVLFQCGKLALAYTLIKELDSELQLYLHKYCTELLRQKKGFLTGYQEEFLEKYISTGEPKETDEFWEELFGIKYKDWYIHYERCEKGEYVNPDEEKKLMLKSEVSKDENIGKKIIYVRNDPQGPNGMNLDDLKELYEILLSEYKLLENQKSKKCSDIVLIFGEGITDISLDEVISFLLHLVVLTEVVLPSSARIIGKETFQNCSSLKRVRLGKNSRLIKIGEGAFKGAEDLADFEFDGSLREVAMDSFEGTSVNLPERFVRQYAEELDKKIKEIEKEANESLSRLQAKREESVTDESDITLIDKEKYGYESRVEKLLEEYKKSIHNIMRYVSNDFIGKVHGIQQEIYEIIDKINKAYAEEAHRREEIDLINYVQDKISEVQQMLKELEEKQKREMSMDKSKLPCEYIDLTDYNFVEVLKQQIDSKSEKLSEETLSILKVKMEVLNALQEQINSTINSLNDMYSKEEERRKEEAFWNEHSYELDKNGEKVAIVHVYGIRKPDGTVPPEKYHYEVERYHREYEELYEKIERILSSRHVKKVKVVFGTNVIENYSELFLEYIDKVVSVSIEPDHTSHTYRVFDFY